MSEPNARVLHKETMIEGDRRDAQDEDLQFVFEGFGVSGFQKLVSSVHSHNVSGSRCSTTW